MALATGARVSYFMTMVALPHTTAIRDSFTETSALEVSVSYQEPPTPIAVVPPDASGFLETMSGEASNRTEVKGAKCNQLVPDKVCTAKWTGKGWGMMVPVALEPPDAGFDATSCHDACEGFEGAIACCQFSHEEKACQAMIGEATTIIDGNSGRSSALCQAGGGSRERRRTQSLERRGSFDRSKNGKDDGSSKRDNLAVHTNVKGSRSSHDIHSMVSSEQAVPRRPDVPKQPPKVLERPAHTLSKDSVPEGQTKVGSVTCKPFQRRYYCEGTLAKYLTEDAETLGDDYDADLKRCRLFCQSVPGTTCCWYEHRDGECAAYIDSDVTNRGTVSDGNHAAQCTQGEQESKSIRVTVGAGAKVQFNRGESVWVRNKQDLWDHGQVTALEGEEIEDTDSGRKAKVGSGMVLITVDQEYSKWQKNPSRRTVESGDGYVRRPAKWRPGQEWEKELEEDWEQELSKQTRERDLEFTVIVRNENDQSLGIRMTWHDDKAKALTGCKVDEILSEGLIPTYNQNVRDDPTRYARLFKRYVLTLDTKNFDVYGNKLQVMKGDIILSVGGSHDESSMRTALRAKGEDIHIRVLRIAPQKTLRVPVRRLPEHLIRGHVKMMVFDFDNTLSVFHVFKGLIGWGDEPDRPSGLSNPSKRRWGPMTPALNPTRVMQVLQVAEETSPGSSTELGQMRLISRFDAGAGRQKGDFAKIAFGGVVRVIELTKFLKGLKERGVKLYIITKGYIGVVKTCLHHLELLDFFDDVYGKVATSSYYDPKEYDGTLGIRRGMSYREHRALASDEEAELLGEQYQADWNPDHLRGNEQVGGKVDLINYLRKLHRFEKEQVVFVDDDPQEIMYAGGTPTPEPEGFTPSEFQCLTLQVLNREGMQKFHMEVLDRWSTFPSGFPQQAKTTDFEESLETKLFAYGFTDRALEQAYNEGFRTEKDVVNTFGPRKDRWNSGLAFNEEASLHEIVKLLAADDEELHPRATELEVRQAFKGDGKDDFFTVVKHIKAQRAMDTEEEIKEKKKKDEEYATWAAKAVPKKYEQQGQSGFSLVIERTLEHMGYEPTRMKEAFKALGKEKKKNTVANAIHWFERTKDSESGWSYADEALILTVVKYGGFNEPNVKQALLKLQEFNKEKKQANAPEIEETYESVVDILENEYQKVRKGTVYINQKRQPKTPEEKAIARLQAALKKKTIGLTTKELIADRRELMEAKIACEQCSLTGCEEFVEPFAEKLSEYMMVEHPEDVKGIKKQKDLAKKQREKDANQPPVGAKKTM